MLESVREYLMDSPVIAAVKDDAGLEKALQTDCQVIFLLYGTILNIDHLVQRVHDAKRICMVHIDLIEGLSNREIAVDGLVRLGNPDGIISTKASHIRRAQQLGLVAVQRAFILDSMSMRSLLAQIDSNHPDFIEILPGILPTIIAELTSKTETPLIAGGLIRTKQDVIQALHAGAFAVSTTTQEIWEM